ncbi:MAG: ABC transporter substrate-binding protein [Candidatus Riflebacteria bacterium HGW-Riflebacteria-2]|jgi:zinc transport system substrate-binding protein|nr:MAG: ABC transporter substrate-binding protein [Candidatus Riflebacteria bacterium HGW-Riflebacteria-2]
MKTPFQLKPSLWLMALVFTALLFSANVEAQPIKVFTSILPQKYLVEQIAGDLVDVEVLVEPGMSPHTFEPLPQQMSRLSRASVFFMIGVPFEQALVKRLSTICPDLELVDTGKNVPRRMMNEQEQDHRHSAECAHGTGASDPHIWLDPVYAVIQAEAIASALIKIMPDNAAAINDGLLKLTTELKTLDEQLASALAPVKGQTMLVFHPAFGYFADRYGLQQQSVEVEGKEPGPRQLAALIRKCRQLGVRVVFVQKQFPVAAARTVASSINGAVVQIDPLAEDYIDNLRRLGEAVLAGVK